MSTEDARRALDLTASDAGVERDQAIAWLLAHPEAARPLLIDDVTTGSGVAPETRMRLLAAIGGDGAVESLEAALRRGHPGESFYAASALVEAGAVGRQVLERYVDSREPAIRNAVAHALGRTSN